MYRVSYNDTMKINSTKRVLEIRSVLMSALSDARSFRIWQRNDNNEISFQIKAKLESIDADGTMSFSLSNDFPLAVGKETFFAIEDSTAVFKTTDARFDGEKLLSSLPEEAKYRERRQHDRKKFKTKDHIQIELNFDEDTILSNVIDISDSGICFLVTQETLKKLSALENFLINAISSDLGFDIEKGKIMNARKYKGGTLLKGEFYALGVMFI